MNYLMFPKAIA